MPGHRPGYLESVEDERYQRDYELGFFARPEPISSTGIFSGPFVDAKLSREFTEKYEQKFGRSEAERTYNAINRFTFYGYPSGSAETIEKHSQRQKEFGEYMVRRLVEEHVDRFAKSNPEVRPIYELKDRIANVDLQVRKGYKVKLHYSYSGNHLDVKLDNPTQMKAVVKLQMDQSAIGPSKIEDTILQLSYPFTNAIKVSAFYEIEDQATTLVGEKKLTSSLSTTLTAAQNVLVDHDGDDRARRHDLVLLGLSWTE